MLKGCAAVCAAVCACVSPQFLLPHSRGSSHGQTRIIRKAYVEDFYIDMIEESYELWEQLEKEAGVKLYRCVCVCASLLGTFRLYLH